MTTPSPADASWALASSEEEQARALAQRYGLEFVDVGSFAPDPELLKSVPVELMFWGDRFGKILDPFQINWSLGETPKA